jgi:hypothetical protein
MAADPRITNAVATAMADVIGDSLDNGYIRIYDGTIPTNADTAVGAQVLLAELRFNAAAAPSATNGVITFAAITADSAANANGTASWFRCLASDGTTVKFDGTVGSSGTDDLNLNTTAIVQNANVSISQFTLTMPKT